MAKKGSKPSGKTEVVAPAKTTKANSGAVKKTPKSTKPTTVKKPVKGKKPVAKRSRKPKAPTITDDQFEAWFFKQTPERFIELTEDWNDLKLKIKLKKHDTYDGWLNYFKTLSPSKIRLLATTGLDILPTEGYAALSFWHDVIKNPSRIKNIHRAGLTTGGTAKTLVDYAKANDRLGVLEAMRDELAMKLQQGAGARDAGTLAAQLTEIMTQIEVYRKRLGPKEETALGSLMSDMPSGKRPPQNGNGHRNTSYASKARVTIEDLETAT